MPIDKVVNEAPVLDVVVTSEEETLPDIEIILEEDGSATVELGEEDASKTLISMPTWQMSLTQTF
jgi:hypothetical protein